VSTKLDTYDFIDKENIDENVIKYWKTTTLFGNGHR